jgi:hypothetical protein
MPLCKPGKTLNLKKHFGFEFKSGFCTVHIYGKNKCFSHRRLPRHTQRAPGGSLCAHPDLNHIWPVWLFVCVAARPMT